MYMYNQYLANLMLKDSEKINVMEGLEN